MGMFRRIELGSVTDGLKFGANSGGISML
jgi:hypothetical protein